MTHAWGAYRPAAPVLDYRTGAPIAGPRTHHTTLPEMIEIACCIGILLLMSQALLGRLGDPEQTGQGAPWLRTMWLPCYAVIITLVAARVPRMFSVWPAAPLLLALVGWAFLTRQWSLDPDATFRRSLALLFATLFGLWIAARFNWRTLVELVALTTLILGIGSFIAVIAFPTFGKMQDVYVGAWRGLWFEKNAMGGYMGRGVLACLSAAVLSPPRRLFWIGAAGFCAMLVFTTGSTTAILAALLAICGVCGLIFLRRGPVWAVVGLWLFTVLVITGAAILLLAPDLFFGAVGKDSTLTGRTGLWEALGRQIDKRPWGGWGYGGFWQDKGGPADEVRKDVQWQTQNADNAWLQIRVEMGLVGVILTASCMITYACAAITRLWKGAEAYWCILFICLLSLNSISESMLARPNDMTWVVFVATFGKLLQVGAASHAATPHRHGR